MTTILAVYGRNVCHGTCDVRCYDAMPVMQLKEPRRNACCCICGGANHALGLKHAVHNVTERRVGLSREELELFALSHRLNANELVVIDRVRVQSTDQARRLADALLDPPMLVPGEDLFVCEEVAP